MCGVERSQRGGGLDGCSAPVCERSESCSLRDHDAPAVAAVGVFAESWPLATPPRPDLTSAVAVSHPPPCPAWLRQASHPLGYSHQRS